MAGLANIAIETKADGSVVVDLETRRAPPDRAKADAARHDANLVDQLSDAALSVISADIMEGVQADIQSRQQWIENYNSGLPLLGLMIERPDSPTNNTSVVRHSLLGWAIIKFQAMANAEMLPSGGPCKVKKDGPASDAIAEALERDMNHYITKVMTEYYPDTDRALYYLGYGGTIFKKVYRCPIRRRPTSEAVYLPDLIISNDTTDLKQAARVTHQLNGISDQYIKKMQDLGYWSESAIIGQPVPSPTPTQTAMAGVTGIQAVPSRPKDQPHTLYETYTNLDLGEWGFEEENRSPGIALPYRVTLDKDSREIFEIRRNWRANDPDRLARRRFVKWGLVPGIGYLDQGYLNILGNEQIALTALERVLIDAGIYSNFPGGVRVKGMRMETNEIRPGPGQFPEIDTSGMPISDAIMTLPYKGPAAEALALMQHIESKAEQKAGVIDVPVGEGTTNVPVGTLMASIEQQAQPVIAVHKRLHNAQSEELDIIRELLVEDEEGMALLKQADKDQPYTAEQLGSAALSPASDPNIPAHIHRLLQATALEQLSTAHPDLYDQRAVQKRILTIGRVDNIDELLIPPQPPVPPPPDPTMQIASMQNEIEKERNQIRREETQNKAAAEAQRIQLEAQAKGQEMASKREADMLKSQQDHQAKLMEIQARGDESQQRLQLEQNEAERDRLSRERIAAMNDQTELIKEGIRADAEPAETDAARDKKAGP